MNPNTAVIEAPRTIGGAMMSVDDVVATRVRVQEIMQQVMIGPRRVNGKDVPGVHYGTIPGTDKPTLFKAGAELLCMVFHIAPEFTVEDLSTPAEAAYRVTCRCVHQGSRVVLAEGIGSASSFEAKYKWRKPVCDGEWDDTPADMRREKWFKGSGREPAFKSRQIRTEPEDIDNTVLKMAAKRAHIAATINALAASDAFAQDLEDLRANGIDLDGDGGGDSDGNRQSLTPASKSGGAATGGGEGGGGDAPRKDASGGMIGIVRRNLKDAGLSEEDACRANGVEKLDGISVQQANAILAWITTAKSKQAPE